MSIRVEATSLQGVLIIEPAVFGDSRGHFKELYQRSTYAEFGIDDEFVQDNFSVSSRGVLRGLHFQASKPQGKLVTCLSGSVFDVVVDINPNSITFRKWVGFDLSDQNHRQLWIPPGYAHGLCVTSEQACFFYKCTEIYDPDDESGISWNDNSLNIDWPAKKPIISPRDLDLPSLEGYLGSLS